MPDRSPTPPGEISSPPERPAVRLTRELIVNRTSTETRVALLESGRLTEVFIERDESRTLVGNIYKGQVSKVLPGMQSAFVSIGLNRDAFLHVDDLAEAVVDREPTGESNRQASQRIEKLLIEGQEILVQLTKDPILGKGARITTRITLPARLLVLMPSVRHVGVSRKITDPEERERLKELVDGLNEEETGLIVRTAGSGAGAEEFVADVGYLTRLWEEIRRRAEVAPPGTLLHAGQTR